MGTGRGKNGMWEEWYAACGLLLELLCALCPVK